MSKNNKKHEANEDFDTEELMNELADMLEAVLVLSGANKAKLPQAVEAYIGVLEAQEEGDELDDEEGYGWEFILKNIENLKASRGDLFR